MHPALQHKMFHFHCPFRQCHYLIYRWSHQFFKPITSSRSIKSLFISSQSNPSSTNKTWERSAKLVKNTDVANAYIEQIRAETVDPSLHLKTIEDELCGAIGKALKRQGEKILSAVRKMEKEQKMYQEYISIEAFDKALQSAHRHNEARKCALRARWELLVQRQAVGFTVDNHNVVHKTFPVGDSLPSNLSSLEESLGSINLRIAHECLEQSLKRKS